MRVALCVKRDLFGLIAARAFLDALPREGIDLRPFCSVKTRPAEKTEPLPRLLKVLERDIPLDVLLPATSWERAAINDPCSLDSWTTLHELKPDGGARALLGWQPDLVVSIRFSLIFPKRVIDAVPMGIINVHPGPLPTYKGLFTPFWQALRGEDSFASSVHVVVPGIDEGPVIAEHRVRRVTGRSLLWHIAALYRGGARLAVQSVAAARRGVVPAGVPQPLGGCYFRMPGEADVEAFLRGPMPVVSTYDYLELLQEALVGSMQAARPIAIGDAA